MESLYIVCTVQYRVHIDWVFIRCVLFLVAFLDILHTATTEKCLPELNCCSLDSIYYLYCIDKKLYDILLYARSPPTSLVLDILWRPCISLTRCSSSSNYSYTIPGGHILTHISLFFRMAEKPCRGLATMSATSSNAGSVLWWTTSQ